MKINRASQTLVLVFLLCGTAWGQLYKFTRYDLPCFDGSGFTAINNSGFIVVGVTDGVSSSSPMAAVSRSLAPPVKD